MIEFTYYGQPVEQGSLKARCVDGRYATAYHTNSPKLKAYRTALALIARGTG